MRHLGFLIVCLSALCFAQAEPKLTLVVEGLRQPLVLTHAADGSGRLFIVEQPGQVRVMEDGALSDTIFLDISDRVEAGGEKGLLGLAFHPEFEENGLFFVNYTTAQNGPLRTVVSRFEVSDDPAQADADSERVLLELSQPFGNHNGGHLAFGPDGYLYVGTGDGGSGGDPEENGQDASTLLGAILRLDVAGDPYSVPADNPFADGEGGQPEIWAYGLRNPWRFSFDRESGDLYIADVGQNAFEEVNVQAAGSAGGENYGWNTMEAEACFDPRNGCEQGGLVLPILSYAHGTGDGNSVTGGYVYRGSELPELQGRYIFGDFGSGRVWQSVQTDSGDWNRELLFDTGYNIASFGEDAAGELYLLDYGGRIFRFSND